MYRAPPNFSQVKTETGSKHSDPYVLLICFVFKQMTVYRSTDRTVSRTTSKKMDVAYCKGLELNP